MARQQREGNAPVGYSIPLFDLSWEEGRTVVVDKEPGQYLGHVTSILHSDSQAITAVYPKGHGRGDEAKYGWWYHLE